MNYKGRLIYVGAILLAIMAQKIFLPAFFGERYGGNIVVMLVLAWTMYDGFLGYFGWAVFAGCLYDLFFYFPVGLHAALFVVIVYGVSFFTKRFSVTMRSSGALIMVMLVAILTVATAFYDLAWAGGRFDIGMNVSAELGGQEIILKNELVNLALFFMCYVSIKKVKKAVIFFA